MSRGGKRTGAGRPKGQGKYGESTRPLRIPESKVEEIMAILQSNENYTLPIYVCSVSAGFPSPADDHVDQKLDLNKHLIKHPTATFFVKASGNSMLKAGIHPGDILIVDRSLEPKNGKIVIAAVNGELTVKKLSITDKGVFLVPENDGFDEIEVTESIDMVIWGVVTNVIHKV